MRIWRRLLAIFIVAFAGFASAQANPDHPIQPSSRQHDVYAIYSLLMPGAVFANLGSDQNQRWAIADTTVNSDDINPALAPEAALKAPPDHPRRFHDAVVDYQQRRNQRQTITHQLHLDRPYTLLSQGEIQEFRAARTGTSVGNDLKQKYNGYPGINYFSDVYFNPQRNAALVYMLCWCGSLCAQSEWVYLEKQDGGQWIRRSGQGAIAPGARAF
jgi:hypothetical protein